MNTRRETGKREEFTRRFTGRAQAYSKFRPRYPHEVLGILESEISFDRKQVVADIGSGTGILSELFLENGNVVYCVEPNDDMRIAAERNLSRRFPSSFRSVKGTAEDTQLARRSFDLVSAGQALHWFDLKAARKEFSRILRKTGRVCIVYNYRLEDRGLMSEYRRISNAHASKRAVVPHIDDDHISKLLSSYKKHELPNDQVLDLKGLVGRVLSASYSPAPDDDQKTEALRKDLSRMFRKYAKNGRITLNYRTRVYLGELRHE